MRTPSMPTILLTLALAAAPGLALPHTSTAAADEPVRETRQVTFRIKGMVTPNCPVLVEAAVKRIAGVEHVETSLERKQAVVRYVVGRTSPEAIQHVIKDRAGFDSEIVAR